MFKWRYVQKDKCAAYNCLALINSTRIGIDTNTTECPAYLGFGTAFAQLRGNFKVAGIVATGSGSGTLLVQQVQVVGG